MRRIALYDVGTIVSAQFPNTADSGYKVRPVLVIAVLPHGNLTDYLVCAITSQSPPDPNMIRIIQSDLKRGSIREGWIRPLSMTNLMEDDISRIIGELAHEKLNEVIDRIHSVICEYDKEA
jgi:mRNA-degrading endonuclease toxin of MazEF toxin-antitoxin module